jgi:flagellar basal body-associated protein FliL
MSEQEDQERDKREMRIMWIFSGVIVLIILGGMGANMLFHQDTSSSGSTELSSQSRQAPQQ